MGRDKIQSIEALEARLRELRAHEQRIVFTNGCFDVLHRGHLELLYRAKSLGDILIVAVNTDASVRRLKGPDRPIHSETDRAELLAALEMVDFVTLFDAPDPYDLVAQLIPDVLVKGGDWQARDVIGGDLVAAHGGKVYIVPLVDDYSSTRIIERIRGG